VPDPIQAIPPSHSIEAMDTTTTESVEPADGETDQTTASPAPGPELDGWCHLHEDRYTLLSRTSKRRATLEHQGKCYICREEKRRDRTRNFSPRDCAGYSLCGEESADACG
jgi:hypothetical protein